MAKSPLLRLSQRIRADRQIRMAVVTLWHLIGICLAYWGAFLLRFDFSIPSRVLATFWQTLPATVFVYYVAFATFRTDQSKWSYFSLDDLMRKAVALIVGTIGIILAIYVILDFSFEGYPRSAFVVTFLLLGLWEGGGRCAVRYVLMKRELASASINSGATCLLVASSSEANHALRLAHEISAELGMIAGIVCNEKSTIGSSIQGRKVYGPISKIGEVVKQLDVTNLLLLPPFTSPLAIRRIMDRCREASVAVTYRVIPSLQDLASNRLNVSMIRKVELEDLLQREPAKFDRSVVRSFLHQKRVLITGAGGSIGSEICRQVAAQGPARIVLFEQSEYALYEIEKELVRAHPQLTIDAITGDIRRTEDIIEAIRKANGIDVLYHTAAYKHVPLMEKNVASAFLNNVIGSANVARVARDHQVERLVLISSDKAVRPTSVMGATKRLAERVMLEAPPSSTTAVAVRFGNVLGSSGSVVPLFKKQIEEHGPVTVTSADMKRYFMTIPEAVELVLMAGIVGEDRQIMVLEMGEPMRIVDMARRLIHLSGFVPDEDIKIEIVGARPGEKEVEELMTDDENVVRTAHDRIWVMAKDADVDEELIDLDLIRDYVEDWNSVALRDLLARYIPDIAQEENG